MIQPPPLEPGLGAPEPDPEFDAWIEGLAQWLESDPMVRLRMSVARRAGLPYSEVEARWGRVDLALELAEEVLQARDSAERCPRCGTHPKDYLNARGREMAGGRVKVELRPCRMCAMIHTAEEQLKEIEPNHHIHVRLARREADENGNPEPILDL